VAQVVERDALDSGVLGGGIEATTLDVAMGEAPAGPVATGCLLTREEAEAGLRDVLADEPGGVRRQTVLVLSDFQLELDHSWAGRISPQGLEASITARVEAAEE
jgi:hypothetical protein